MGAAFGSGDTEVLGGEERLWVTKSRAHRGSPPPHQLSPLEDIPLEYLSPTSQSLPGNPSENTRPALAQLLTRGFRGRRGEAGQRGALWILGWWGLKPPGSYSCQPSAGRSSERATSQQRSLWLGGDGEGKTVRETTHPFVPSKHPLNLPWTLASSLLHLPRPSLLCHSPMSSHAPSVYFLSGPITL